jgi:predicted GIY-YIG superfamily endonuclease
LTDEAGAYAYMLRCANGAYYVGSARLGLEQRLVRDDYEAIQLLSKRRR